MAIPHRNQDGDDADYYGLLGVSTQADEAAIRHHYRLLARQYHPDIAGTHGTEMMKQLNAAYHTLSDPTRRREYDLRMGIRPLAPAPEPRPIPVARPTPPPARPARVDGGPLRLYRTIEGLDGPVNALAFAQGGDLLGMGTSDGQVTLWRLEANQRVAILHPPLTEVGRPGVLRELRLSPQGTLAMSWGLYMGTRVWNVATRASVWHSAVSGPSGMMDGVLFDSPAMARLAIPAAPLADAEIDPFQWADAGRHGTDILTRPLNQAGAIAPLWAVPLHSEEPRMPGSRGPRIHLRVLSWDGDVLLTFATGPVGPTISNASILRLWGLRMQGRVGGAQPQPLGQVLIPARALWYPVAVSALASVVAVHLEDRAMRLYDVRTGRHIDLHTGPLPPATLAALSPDGALLALAPPDGRQVDLWATATGLRIQHWELGVAVTSLLFAPPGYPPTLAIGRVDGISDIWGVG